ncbi:MAG: rhodanese-like domain-containing protein [Bryobacter sp.]|nr:rhodanese-like domain-containing protein [Bryobacter sp.]
MIFAFAISSFAQSILMEAPELVAKLNQPGLVLLHVGTPEDFAQAHLPGALLITLQDLSQSGPGGLRLEMPPAAQLAATLEKYGVTNQSEVVIYSGNDSFQSATRIWFTFEYLSLPARFLNGGLAYWRSQGLPVTQETSAAKASSGLQVKPRPDLIVDAAYLAAQKEQGAFALIDARTPNFYSGTEAGIAPRAGHIPGARNAPFPGFFAADKRFKAPQELVTALGPGDSFVTYCHIGMQATVPYFAARLVGKTVRLYDGSFQDWSQRSELPVAKD